MATIHAELCAGVVVIAMLVVGTVTSRHAVAYTVQGYTWAAAPVSYYLNPTNMDLPDVRVETAVFAGADTWRAQSRANFSFQYAGRSTQTTNTFDGINLVMFRNATRGSAIATRTRPSSACVSPG